MISKVVTVSSKNQITLPAEYVRSLALDESRQIHIYLNGKELVVRPEISAEERMRKQWKKLPHFTGTKNDEELKQAVREAVVKKTV